MTPEPTDKLDATTTVVANGPADATLELRERIVRRHATGPSLACLSRMLGNGHVLVLRGAGRSNASGLPVRSGARSSAGTRSHPRAKQECSRAWTALSRNGHHPGWGRSARRQAALCDVDDARGRAFPCRSRWLRAHAVDGSRRRRHRRRPRRPRPRAVPPRLRRGHRAAGAGPPRTSVRDALRAATATHRLAAEALDVFRVHRGPRHPRRAAATARQRPADRLPLWPPPVPLPARGLRPQHRRRDRLGRPTRPTAPTRANLESAHPRFSAPCCPVSAQ